MKSVGVSRDFFTRYFALGSHFYHSKSLIIENNGVVLGLPGCMSKTYTCIHYPFWQRIPFNNTIGKDKNVIKTGILEV